MSAGSCLEADVAAKAAFLLGPDGPAWLDARGLAGRFLPEDGPAVPNDVWNAPSPIRWRRDPRGSPSTGTRRERPESWRTCSSPPRSRSASLLQARRASSGGRASRSRMSTASSVLPVRHRSPHLLACGRFPVAPRSERPAYPVHVELSPALDRSRRRRRGAAARARHHEPLSKADLVHAVAPTPLPQLRRLDRRDRARPRRRDGLRLVGVPPHVRDHRRHGRSARAEALQPLEALRLVHARSWRPE